MKSYLLNSSSDISSMALETLALVYRAWTDFLLNCLSCLRLRNVSLVLELIL